jgi:hypothetical protein
VNVSDWKGRKRADQYFVKDVIVYLSLKILVL